MEVLYDDEFGHTLPVEWTLKSGNSSRFVNDSTVGHNNVLFYLRPSTSKTVLCFRVLFSLVYAKTLHQVFPT
jgi:hypothetical protein